MTTSETPASAYRSRILDDPRLLERELMGLRLHELIAELVRGDNRPWSARQDALADAALGDLLRDDKAEVLERGLAVLSKSRLQMLLDQPMLLLELQELLLGRGGVYWDQVTESLPEPSRVRLSEADWQERLEQTFVRRRKAKSKLRGGGEGRKIRRQPPSPVQTPAQSSWLGRCGGLIAAVLIAAVLLTAALLGTAAGWYRAEMRLATARREHADEVAALQNSFEGQLAAVQQEQVSERIASYCRLLDKLSSLPATEQLVSLPADGSPGQRAGLPPDEESAAQQERLPEVEESLVSLSAREQAIVHVADALRHDAAAWAELTRDARPYLEHPDPPVSHGAAMALEKTEY